jgi:hypothetical protein
MPVYSSLCHMITLSYHLSTLCSHICKNIMWYPNALFKILYRSLVLMYNVLKTQIYS